VTHTATIHHDAVTHTDAVAHASSTHDTTLSFDAIVAPSADGTGSDNGLAQFAMLMGLVAAAGAGRYSSTRDVIRQTLAQWTSTSRTAPATAVYLATNSTLTDAEVDDGYQHVTGRAAPLPSEDDLSEDDPEDLLPSDALQLQDTPPSLGDPASQLARARFTAFLDAQRAMMNPVIYPDQIWMPPPGDIGLDPANQSGPQKFAVGFLKSLVNAGVGTVESVFKLAEFSLGFAIKSQLDPVGAANDLKAFLGTAVSTDTLRAISYGIANETKYLGEALDSADPGRVGEALGDIFFGAFSAVTVVGGGAGLARGVLGVKGAAAAARTADAAFATGVDAAGATGVAARQLRLFTGIQPVIKGRNAEAAVSRLFGTGQPGQVRLLGRQITVRTTRVVNGETVATTNRLDAVGQGHSPDQLFNLEVKAADSLPTQNQLTGWNNLASSGADGRGANAALAGIQSIRSAPTVLARVADDGSITFTVEVRLASDTAPVGLQWADDLVRELNQTASQWKAVGGQLVPR
jgi:hypothetical protein